MKVIFKGKEKLFDDEFIVADADDTVWIKSIGPDGPTIALDRDTAKALGQALVSIDEPFRSPKERSRQFKWRQDQRRGQGVVGINFINLERSYK